LKFSDYSVNAIIPEEFAGSAAIEFSIGVIYTIGTTVWTAPIDHMISTYI
jgi:hypothetical protein